MARALIVGAGAIGRGFLPWVLSNLEIDFYDVDVTTVNALESNGGYLSFMTTDGGLMEKQVRPRLATNSLDRVDLAQYDIAFVAVGPRNVVELPVELSQLRCPVYSLENDPSTTITLKSQFDLDACLFGVPDVIASSTASPENRSRDPLSLHTENGILYLEDSPRVSRDLRAILTSIAWTQSEQLRQEWDAKLFLHNTPHCVAAYLGHLADFEYLHEGFDVPFIRRTVEGVIEEMLLSLKMTTSYDHRFLEAYAVKELRRFANDQLFDPISRVAREPLRKLHPTGRLTGALRLSMMAGVAPHNLMLGIASALNYVNPGDPDHRCMSFVGEFGIPAFLRFHLAIPSDSVEAEYIAANYPAAHEVLLRSLK